jgi:hypothetical protein
MTRTAPPFPDRPARAGPRPLGHQGLGFRAIALVLAGGAAASLWLNLPGQFSPDSVWQLAQGRSGVFNAWHPPVMAALLGLFDRLSPGAPGFIVLQAALGFGGLLAFAALAPRPRAGAVWIAAALAASPLMLIYQGEVWKDVLFADAAVAGFAALAWAGRTWASPARRHGLAGLAAVLFALAALTRQNGVLVPLWGAAGLAGVAWRAGDGRPGDGRPGRGGRALGYGLALLGASLALAAGGGVLLARHGDGEPAQALQLEWLQVWDLAGAVRADPGLPLAGLARDAPATARFVRRATAAYTPERVDTLVNLAGADAALAGAGPAVGRQWRTLILTRPDLYARVRLAGFAQLLAAPRPLACRPLFIGVDAPPELLRTTGLAPRHRAKDAWARRYGLAFVGTPALSHLAYAALALVLLALATRDLARPPAPADRIAVVALLAAAGSVAGSFLVIGVACDYRYLYFLDLAAMAALLHRAAVGFARPQDARPAD